MRETTADQIRYDRDIISALAYAVLDGTLKGAESFGHPPSTPYGAALCLRALEVALSKLMIEHGMKRITTS